MREPRKPRVLLVQTLAEWEGESHTHQWWTPRSERLCGMMAPTGRGQDPEWGSGGGG